MSMIWTDEPPVRAGFYYWQGGRLQGNEVVVAQVNVFMDKAMPPVASELLLKAAHKYAPANGPAKNWGGRWAGPLPQPMEARP